MGLKAKDKVIAILLIVLAIVVFVGGRYHDNNTGFTTEKWVAYQGNSRQLILQDLRDRTQFVGMTTEAVKELLGEPEEETETFLNYYVGIPQGLFGTKADGEKEYFVISLEDGKVTKTEVCTAGVLPKESIYRIIGDATEDAVLYPEGAKE
ncbi:MAG: hypothetical protein MR278_06545 [Bacteroidales bacterium]|nr:hypothetical protein [Anaerotignum sp.]MCI5679616.1 hypothetical protein [Bacteroidales bacterium]MDY3925791.1 hypothetical protein [Anaerotignum sp.]